MKNSEMQKLFDGIREIAEKRFPQKDTAREQYNAYGKVGLLVFCENRGLSFDVYLDLLEELSA